MTKNYKVFYCNALMYNFSIEKIIPWACDLMIQWGVFTKLKWCSILEVKEAWKEVFSLASFMPLPNMICELIASWCFQALNLHSKHHDAFKGKTLNTIVKMCARCKTASSIDWFWFATMAVDDYPTSQLCWHNLHHSNNNT